MRRMIVFGVATAALTVGIVVHNGYASHRWRAHEKTEWAWQDRTLRHLDREVTALRRDDLDDRRGHRELPIARRRG